MARSFSSPYDGSSPPFRIGVKPLEPSDWFDADRHLPDYLAQKEQLAAARFADIFVAEANTETAQREVLEMLAEYLPARFPAIYRRAGRMINVSTAGRKVGLDEAGVSPLWTAAMLVQEDLVLMRKGDDGWRLAAAALCFPSSWSLAEKFGLPLNAIHAPVPGFGEGTRHAKLIERMFDHLRPEMPVIRWNWSIYGDDRLFHPESMHLQTLQFGDGTRAENVFMRAERQTLRALPQSSDILFTIRIYVEPLAELARRPDAANIAASLISQLEGLNDEQMAYKGLQLQHARLLLRLNDIART